MSDFQSPLLVAHDAHAKTFLATIAVPLADPYVQLANELQHLLEDYQKHVLEQSRSTSSHICGHGFPSRHPITPLCQRLDSLLSMAGPVAGLLSSFDKPFAAFELFS